MGRVDLTGSPKSATTSPLHKRTVGATGAATRFRSSSFGSGHGRTACICVPGSDTFILLAQKATQSDQPFTGSSSAKKLHVSTSSPREASPRCIFPKSNPARQRVTSLQGRVQHAAFKPCTSTKAARAISAGLAREHI